VGYTSVHDLWGLSAHVVVCCCGVAQYGAYGREDSTMAVVNNSGAIGFHMLRRSANLDVSDTPPGPPPEQDIPLNIPKKTKLYVEQTQRERDQATEMHRLFQRDLCKLRLNTARAYVKIITDGQGPMSYSSSAALRLNAAVIGLGPRFKLVLLVQNNGARSLSDIVVTFNYNPAIYRLPSGLFKLPLLLPVRTLTAVGVGRLSCWMVAFALSWSAAYSVQG
jgi:Bardet-Biedl syndrome 1 protein